MNTHEVITQLQQYRQELYRLLPLRRDAVLDLLDALSGSPSARSPVELSLSPLFRRGYGSVRDATTHFFLPSSPEQAATERRKWEQKLARLIGRYLPAPRRRSFWLLGTDVVPIPRPFARTLADRSYVYQPNPIPGCKPVTIGHRYSVTAFLPEPEHPDDPAWVVPLNVRRVRSDEKATVVAAEQVTTLLQDEQMPFRQHLCVHVADSAYSAVEHLGRVGHLPNLVTVTRAAENRVFYRQPLPPEGTRSQGHPTWYGVPFNLKDPHTWGTPDVTATTTFTTKKGRTYRVQLQGWHNMLMRGKRDLPMHRYPFTLVRVVVVDEQEQPVFKHTLWLIVMGARRGELSLVEAWESYCQRYDMEHYLRFGKQRLLMAAFQTPEVEHEENWLQIVQLASVQMWLGRELAGPHLRPWERYLPRRLNGSVSPSQVQRDWEGIIRQIGTPAQAPKRRGKSPGRAKGTRLTRRTRPAVVKKPTIVRNQASPPA